MLEPLYRQLGVKAPEEKKLAVMQKQIYDLSPELLAIKSRIEREPVFAGKFVGSARLVPSLDEIQRIGKEAPRKAWLNKKSEWMFICGRDVLEKGIEKTEGTMSAGSLVAVLNQHNECLGYGEWGKGIRRLFDIGDFLRRERKHLAPKAASKDF